MDLNEFRTRKEKIDISLGEQGWKVDNPSQVRVEVDTKQSNFKKNDYKPASETLKNDLESKVKFKSMVEMARDLLKIRRNLITKKYA